MVSFPCVLKVWLCVCVSFIFLRCSIASISTSKPTLITGDVIRALVAAGAKLGGVNSQGLTPLGSALTSGNAVALAALLKSGADAGVMARGCVCWGVCVCVCECGCV